MNHRRLVMLIASGLFAGSLLPGRLAAQPQSLAEQLVGTWTLVSFENVSPEGVRRELLGSSPRGVAVFDNVGRYVVTSTSADRPKWKSRNRLEASTEELASAGGGIISLFGTWSLNETDKTITRRIEGSFVPNNEGVEFRTVIKLAGDELTLTDSNAAVGGKIDAVYKRVRR